MSARPEAEVAAARRAEVVALARAGMTTEAIGAALGVSTRTASKYLRQARREGAEIGQRKRRATPKWPAAKDAQLAALWNQTSPELTTAEIAERMGISRHAVIGRVHLLCLPARKNPVTRREDGTPREARPAPLPEGASTLEALPSLRAEAVAVAVIVVSGKELMRLAVVEDLPAELGAVNAWRAARGLAPFQLAQVTR